MKNDPYKIPSIAYNNSCAMPGNGIHDINGIAFFISDVDELDEKLFELTPADFFKFFAMGWGYVK